MITRKHDKSFKAWHYQHLGLHSYSLLGGGEEPVILFELLGHPGLKEPKYHKVKGLALGHSVNPDFMDSGL